MKNKLLNAFVIALILFQAVAPIGALAYTSTDQADYSPGSVVTIFGDNSDGAGYLGGETVQVDATGPNGYTATCDATADESGAWACQITLWGNAYAVGSYSYTAIGLTSGVLQNGTFTDAINLDSFESTCTTVTNSFTSGTTVCAKATGLGSNPSGKIEWWAPSAVSATRTTTFTPANGNISDAFAPATCGTWTLKLYIPATAGSTTATDTFAVTNCVSATTLSVAPATGSYGGTVNLSATLTKTSDSSAVSGKSISFTLNGSPAGSATTNGSGVATLSGVSLGTTVANTYPTGVGASFSGDASFAASSGTASLTVNKASSTTTVSCPLSVTYNGSAQTPCTASYTTSDGQSGSLTVSYLNNTNAGTATANASYGGDANHAASSDSENFTIGQATSTTTVNCPVGPYTYSGSAQTPCSAAYTTSDGLSGSLTVSYTNNTNAGTATASASYVGDANHAASSDSENFTIGQATSTTSVTCPAGPYTYDGSAQTPCSASYTTSDGLSGPLTVNYSNNTDAGTATASASYVGDANHAGSSDSENFTIGKAATTTTVTCGAGPFTYTGSAQAPCSANVTGPGGLNQSLTVNYTNNVNAGTATASASYSESANYLGSSDSENFTIGQATSTTTVTCPAGPYTYDGSAQTPCSASYSTSDGLSGSLLVTYLNNTNAGTATASASYVGDANHESSSDSDTFTIDKAATTTTVTCPAGPYTYNGAAQTPCSANVAGPGGLNQSLTVNYTNNVNAGTATASASYAESANYLGSSDTDTFTIDKAPTTTTVTCPAGPYTYNGSAQTPCSANVTGPGGLNQSLTVSYLNNVNAGTATASASYAESANYLGSSDSDTFTIDKAPTTTTVVCPTNVTYDGSAQEPCSGTVTGAGGLNETLTVSYLNNVNAGTATASASYAESANYLGSSDSETFTIDKASSSTVITCPSNVTYTGSPLTPCSATATGAGGLNASVTVVYGNNTNAGTATADATYAGDANHDGSTATQVTFTIDKASSTTTISCPSNVTYTGSPLTPCTAAVTGAGGLNQSLTVSYSNNTNAGTATASASYAGDSNHFASSDTENFTIDKAPSATTVTCPASVTYTGSAQTPCTAVATGAGGLNQSLTVSYTNNVNPGTNTASASATFAGDTNHLGSNDSETFSILFSLGACYGGPGHTVLQPINGDGTSSWRARNTVPVKFRVCDANGNSLGSMALVFDLNAPHTVAAPYLHATSSGALPVDEAAVSNTPDSQFRWSASDQQWIFNLNTNNLSAGKTYTYRIYLADGTYIEFKFGLK